MDINQLDEQSNSENSSKSAVKIRLILIVVTLILLANLFVLRNPTSGGPKIVIFALGLIFALIFQATWLAVILLPKILPQSKTIRHPFLLSQIIAFVGIFLIGLQTLNQLRLIDVVLITLLGSITYFYILRRF